ncbi:MAG: aminopeptidase P N-terminal domain-containing protein, partial [Acidimicrobiales bacterium]
MNDDDEVAPDVSAEHPLSDHWVWVSERGRPWPRRLVEAMTEGWQGDEPASDVHPMAAAAARRRALIAEEFPGRTLVVPTGGPKVRSNDTDYRFRPGSDFFYLTGCDEPDCVLVVSPGDDGPESVLYIAARRDQRSHDFFTNDRYGELWVGPRRGVDEARRYFAIDTAPLEVLDERLAGLAAGEVVTLRDVDSTVDDRLKESDDDARLAEALGELRLVKESDEVAEVQRAIDATVRGFEDVVRALARARGRGERVVEGVFNLRARVEGNDVGYGTIAASGHHACTLHYTRNDGELEPGSLLLLDAGVEGNTLYT